MQFVFVWHRLLCNIIWAQLGPPWMSVSCLMLLWNSPIKVLITRLTLSKSCKLESILWRPTLEAVLVIVKVVYMSTWPCLSFNFVGIWYKITLGLFFCKQVEMVSRNRQRHTGCGGRILFLSTPRPPVPTIKAWIGTFQSGSWPQLRKVEASAWCVVNKGHCFGNGCKNSVFRGCPKTPCQSLWMELSYSLFHSCDVFVGFAEKQLRRICQASLSFVNLSG